nr:olfactory receptor 52B2-like [Pelodiscus sinensis]|eukprot:XP_006126172.2 olfactory receptor 52B2-like [Pelodiscus sinensis]
MESLNIWLSIPFCSMYVVALLGNGFLLFIVIKDPSLHEPMYVFLAMLAVIDIMLSSTTIPQTLSIFWFGAREIAFGSCFTQMFCIHFVFATESAILLAMAYDRYVAICNPLRYTAILTRGKVGKIMAAAVIRGLCLVASLTYLLKQLPYCGPNVIHNTYCNHMGIARLACADITLHVWYGLTVAFVTKGLDAVFIVVSYLLILQAVFRLPSKDARLKALSTCSFHVSVMLMFYIPAFFSIFAYRFLGAHLPPYFQSLQSNLFHVVPPMLNPLVYGVRMKQIQERVLPELCKKGKGSRGCSQPK